LGFAQIRFDRGLGDLVRGEGRGEAAMSGVFGRVFRKSKEQSQATALASLDKLNEVKQIG